ncbi:MAG TPA: TIGR02453 family protein [Myxococcota bacterium]|nr:TIGR02453 family protein [Myxococcota bacterium]
MPAFSPALFDYLADLAENNDRTWFQSHRDRYERLVKADALSFIAALAPRMAEITTSIRVDPKALFRIHRDTRFSHDKSPYKTHVGLHFRHTDADHVHTPGFYLHLEPSGCFFACGIWQPDPPTLLRLRQRMVDDADGWAAVRASVPPDLTWESEALQRPPRGFPKDHVHDATLRLKSLVVSRSVPRDDVVADDLPERFTAWSRAGAPLLADLCRTLDLAW